MLAKAMANEPAASSMSPRWPKNSMESMDREYIIRAVRAIGKARLRSAFVSVRMSEGLI